MGRFYKTHTRWMSNSPVKKTATVVADDLEVNLGIKSLDTFEKATEADVISPEINNMSKEEVAPKETVESAKDTPAVMFIEKTKAEEGITCKIEANTDYDEIRYNVGSKKVTEKNKSRCKRYEGEFILEEDSVVNASAFKDDILVCSVQG